ncbi:hypothetical protein PHYBLDRAFT_167630 [Phycomyces blakesleeanus NRRL 1555(-)]|uniref:ATP-dependent DNA helicase n=1 Tax=Phycomyces blakesleeanus (strain ATCC 8743b / DSM 1359 / FGSC 10004 / NBRC 33097 / NRRL 1555) TaxID=763407 RepID=A0A162XDU1_PHYB8|nr:hypothetical protein PHYBLDRAFT_167630 [Phycomyces blakesleeanus NRRL 1555(-)]OAD74205.1 hypothetical protein PHYBLDRAFT_167630 [Phycomyces blakesleeanus NRRL 1555(-)]|eukprot:XP_018292245.1 hypothetical protein PHYBLDRAFT_167630 [Phycomyces blakesleeanus NRRL 1555(-)]
MLGHSRSTHKQCLMNPKNISLHIPQKRTNVDEYPAESSRTAALRIRSEPVQDQNLDIETSTFISVSELTEFPLANETITEVLEAVMEEEIEETSSDEEVTGREEEVEEISTVNRGSILPHCPHCNGTDHRRITSRFCPNNNSSRARGSRNRGRGLNNIARLPAISEPAVDNRGDMDIECRFCGAMMWAHEKNSRSSLRSPTFSMCCNKGKHVLPQIEPTPTGIAELLNYRTRDGKKFLENIRSYNSTMSFTSLGAKIDTSVGNNINGAYNFRIHGTICHRIGSILPVTESDIAHPKFAQIDIYDSAAQIDQRQYHSPQLERSVLEKIQSILMETNPFVHLFRTMDQISREKGQSIDLTLRLVAEGPRDQRRYNAPTASEIAVLIMNNEEGTSRDIVLHTRANFQQNINEYHRSYDALHYVLLFPHGEDGWTIDASSLSGEHVTVMQWYSNRLMYRRNTQHLLHLFGRLFQQYIVDMYAKVEQDRLHFITSNQNRLHVDLYSGIQDAVIHNDCGTGKTFVFNALLQKTRQQGKIALAVATSGIAALLLDVRLAFAMTINKSQGQTLESVGLYLPAPVFSHGQLYVALSRVRKPSTIKIMLDTPANSNETANTVFTDNVVFKEVFDI